MKAFVFDPLWTSLLAAENEERLEKASVEVVLSTEEASVRSFSALYEGGEPRILALNPDYVGWSLPAETYRDIPNLKAIVIAATSYGWIDTEEATKQGVPIINIRNFSTDAVADWAIMMMLNVARKVPLLIKDGFPLNFGSDFKTYQGINLKGKKVGVIGLGNIGHAIAERCHSLGMDVSYWSQSSKKSGYHFCDLATLFKQSDIIFPAMADNETTKALITDALLESMKPEAIFISVVHKYYNHALLLKRVENGDLYGYGFEDEQPALFSTYKGNVWAAPAYAWCTDNSLRKAMDSFVTAIADASEGKFHNRIN